MDSGRMPLPVGENILSIISSGSIDFTLISAIQIKIKGFRDILRERSADRQRVRCKEDGVKDTDIESRVLRYKNTQVRENKKNNVRSTEIAEGFV